MRGSGIRLKCQHCEFENLEQATYCSGCGELLTPMMSDEVTSQTFKKKKRLILVSIIGVLILTLISGGIWLATKPDLIEVAKSNYQVNNLAAYQTAQKKMSSNQKLEMEAYLLDEANAVLESFKAEGLYYKEAIRKLERIKLYLTLIAPVQEVQNEVELIHTSREVYEQGKAWVEVKEWENAKECFESVSELDPNYASAKRYLDSILRWKLQEIEAEALAHYEAGDYEKALEFIESGLSLELNNEILISLKQNIETLFKQPLVQEEKESDNESVGFGEKLNSMIQSGLEALDESIKSFFNEGF